MDHSLVKESHLLMAYALESMQNLDGAVEHYAQAKVKGDGMVEVRDRWWG
jgi:hypothetical protein